MNSYESKIFTFHGSMKVSGAIGLLCGGEGNLVPFYDSKIKIYLAKVVGIIVIPTTLVLLRNRNKTKISAIFK